MEIFRLSQCSRFVDKQNRQNGNHHFTSVKREIKSENYDPDVLFFKNRWNVINEIQVKQEIKRESHCPDVEFVHDIKDEWDNCNEAGITKIINHDEPKSNLLFKGKRSMRHSGLSRRQKLLRAIRLHQLLIGVNPNSLNKRQLSSLTWAESVIVRNKLWETKNIANKPGSHSNHTAHNEAFITEDLTELFTDPDIQIVSSTNMELLPDPLPPIVTSSTNKKTPDTFQLSVVDFGSPGGRYTQERAQLITKTLSEAVIKSVTTNPSASSQPSFGSPIVYDGVVVLECKDQVSYDFAKSTLHGRRLWDGSDLKTLPPPQNPFSSIGYIVIPQLSIDYNRILDILQAQNKSVNMVKWKILNETSFLNGTKEYSIMLYNPPISYLKNKQLKLSFGAGEVILKNYGCKWLWNCQIA